MEELVKKIIKSIRLPIALLCGKLPGSSISFGPPRHNVNSTIEWALLPEQVSKGESRLTVLSHGSCVVRTPPSYADSQFSAIFDKIRCAHIKPRYVAELKNGRYWGRSFGYIIDSSDCLHRDLSPTFEDLTANHNAQKRHDGLESLRLPRLSTKSKVIAAINTPFSPNFHHWLLDCVPKFGLLQSAGWDLNNIDYFILPPPDQPWHREVLEKLDIPARKVISSSTNLHLQAETLIVPSFSEPSRQPDLFNNTPEGLKYVKAMFDNNAHQCIDKPKKIVISRQAAKFRRLVNWDDVVIALAAKGYVPVALENLSLSEQAALMREAESIIMPTGGGLANIVFCNPGTKIIELFSPSYLPPFASVIAGSLGLDYYALVGENFINSTGHSDEGASDDILISIKSLLEHA